MEKEPHIDNIDFMGLEAGGEMGELQNAIKKLSRWYNDLPGGVHYAPSKEAIAEEAADVIICVDIICNVLKIDLTEAIPQKFDKTSNKYELKTKFY